MLTNVRPVPRLLLFIVVFCTLWLALVSLTNQLRAQSQPNQSEFKDGELTTVQEKFLADVMPAENLAPMPATPCVLGMAGIYPCNNIDMMSFLPLASIGGASGINGNDNWGWTDPLDGSEYAIMGRTDGVAFVNITDPENPIYLGSLPRTAGSSINSWRDIKVYANHAFIVSEGAGQGVQVFDLTRLRNVPTPPVTFNHDVLYTALGRAHNIVINEDTGYAYAVGVRNSNPASNNCSGGLHMINIQDPLNPTFAGCFSADGYTHDAQCVLYFGPDAEHRGKEICFNSNEDTVTIVDVTNKSAPVMLARQGYTGARYTHQAWLTEDQKYLLVDDELDEQNNGHNTRTYIWDVSNLDAPVLINNYTAQVESIDHNLYIVGNYAYLANYRSGLRVLNITNISAGSLSEVAFFDIYPLNDNPSFNGAWSVYPYFNSGNIIVSGIEQGLFVLRPTTIPPDFRLNAPNNDINFCGAGSQNVPLMLASVYGYNQAITLTTTTLPAGLTATFTNPVAVPGNTQMTLTATGMNNGFYVFAVYGYDGTVEHYKTIKVRVDNDSDNTTLVSPTNGAAAQPVQPTFIWNAVDGAYAYNLQVATDAAFTNVVMTVNGIVDTQYTPTTPLSNSTTYYWRVQASRDCGLGAYSAIFSFTTLAVPSNIYLPIAIRP